MLNISKDEKRYSEIELDLHKKLAYEKGRASIIEEFKKIKAEIRKLTDINPDYPMDRTIHISRNEVLEIIDKHISELKGENNE